MMHRYASAFGLWALAGLILSVGLTAPCHGQDAVDTEKPASADGFYATDLGADFVIPDSPGLTILGLDPSTATHPKSPRELAASVLNAVDRDGNLQSGLAIDTAPYLLLNGRNITRADYLGDPLTKQLSRVQLSFATTKGTQDSDKSVRAGLGLRVTPVDLGDPRTDRKLAECLFGLLQKKDAHIAAATQNLPPLCGEGIPAPCTPADQWQAEHEKAAAAADAIYDAKVDDCRKESGRRLWNRSSFMLGGAPAWIASDGNVSSLTSSGGAFWATLAYGFDEFCEDYAPPARGVSNWLYYHAETLIHFSYLVDENLPSTSDASKRDSLSAGGLFRIGARWGAIGINGSFTRDDPDKGPTDTFYSISAKGDLRLTDSLWLSLSVGGQGGRSNGKDEGFVLSAVKWSLPEAPQFAKKL
jgi:hypothetical protein